MNKLKLVKFIVFILTFLLIFGLLTAVGTIWKKSARRNAKTEISLNQPVHSKIADWHVENNTLYILVKGGKTPDRILVVDPKNPALTTTIKIN